VPEEPPSTATRPTRAPRIAATMREGERVTPLELFFDLVFVLALTQCTALMYAHPTWGGLLKGALVLGILWWSWGGYAWLTSVVDPEEGAVRIAMFAAMAAFLVAALAVPGAFGSEGLLFACAYAVVRTAHIALFLIASRDDPPLRRSVVGLAGSTAVGVGLLVGASFVDGGGRVALWGVALALDTLGPFFFGAEGWKLVPGHFAERHGLIVLIALGESIVALGVGAEAHVDAGVVVAAVLGIVVAAALWWVYFDVTALVAERVLSRAAPGRERNEMARDSYSYLHFLMVAGIALLAVGLKRTLGHTADPLHLVRAAELLGGAALYLLALVAFRLRNVHTLSGRRLVCALVLLALIPAGAALPSLVTLALEAVLLVALIAYEALRYAGSRDRVRHQGASPPTGPQPEATAAQAPGARPAPRRPPT
jgi:low temperature requirement protein LtrA